MIASRRTAAADISDYKFEEIGGWPWKRKKRRDLPLGRPEKP